MLGRGAAEVNLNPASPSVDANSYLDEGAVVELHPGRAAAEVSKCLAHRLGTVGLPMGHVGPHLVEAVALNQAPQLLNTQPISRSLGLQIGKQLVGVAYWMATCS